MQHIIDLLEQAKSATENEASDSTNFKDRSDLARIIDHIDAALERARTH